MQQELISKLGEMESVIVPTLFKPVQFRIINKLKLGLSLSENEKRYLRGNMKRKIEAIKKIIIKEENQEEYIAFLKSIGSYYITGLDALKHNGYGWYFDTKIVEVINTKIKGRLKIGSKTLKLIRVKSITNSKCKVDKNTKLKFATNEQISKDIKITKNRYTKLVCRQLLLRYGSIFSGKKNNPQKQEKIDYSKYGV